MTKAACVILNYKDAKNSAALAEIALGYPSIGKVFVVDNCSPDDSLRELNKLKERGVSVIESDKNNGYGAGNNIGVAAARNEGYRFALIANPDVKFTDECISKLVAAMEQGRGIGVSSAIQKDLHGCVVDLAAWKIPTAAQLAAASSGLLSRIVGRPVYETSYLHSSSTVEVDCVPGAMLMVNTDCFERVGGYDKDIFLYCEETVLGIRMKRAGFKTLLITEESYQHLHRQNESGASDSRSQLRDRIFSSRKLIMEKYYRSSTALRLFQTLAFQLSRLENAFACCLSRPKRSVGND